VGLSNVPNTDFTSAVTANTAKVSFDATSSTRLGNTSGTNTGDQTLTSLGAAPSSGSANYIQNGTSQQSANLNISGNGFFEGNVGIGTTSPNNKLTISNAGASGFEFNPTTGDIFTFNRQSSVFTPMVFSASSYNFNVGAATFASSVTATEFLAGLSGQTTFIGSVQTGNIMQIGGSQELRLQTYDNGWKDRLTFVNNGAATFASSVTATTFILPSNSNPVTINTNALSLQQGYNASFISAYRSGGIKTELYFTSNATIFDSNVTASGFFQSSDKRLKNIYKRDGDVAYFKWKNGSDDKMHIGYIAQEVKKEFPDQVNKDDKGMLSVNYIEVLVAKIQDLEKRISELEKSK
ncbi:MAG: tail fiber domain-containing protein, partial [Nonlabens sp.]|uniref:tail fiber domain-containing protein n=1 Tax=Nonlabens sp. TaxID=1888209 RepID=UPI0035A63797